jgi:hypothetical protein
MSSADLVVQRAVSGQITQLQEGIEARNVRTDERLDRMEQQLAGIEASATTSSVSIADIKGRLIRTDRVQCLVGRSASLTSAALNPDHSSS